MQLWNRAKRRRIGGRSVRPGFEVCEPRLALVAGGVLPTLVDGSYGRAGAWDNELPVAIGDVTYYAGRTNATAGGGQNTGVELWRTDGTAAGTWLVKDINPGPADSGPTELTVIDGTLLFIAYTEDSGRELWKSDGTAAGTRIVRDIFPGGEYTIGGPGFNGPYSSDPRFLTNVNGTLFFEATDEFKGDELWKSDGTFAGTVLVNDSLPGADSKFPHELHAANGTLFFAAGYNGEIWKSDGTAAGTVLVKSVADGAYAPPGSFITVGRQVFFQVEFYDRDTEFRWELWRTDGTSAGTRPVLRPNGVPLATAGWDGTVMGGRLYVPAFDDATGFELWSTDGTPAGTRLVKDIGPGTTGGVFAAAAVGRDGYHSPGAVTVGNRVYFAANDGTRGYELWKTDGTTAGTVLVKDLFPGANSGLRFSGEMEAVNDRLYFSATPDASETNGLWTSDGTTAGTMPIDVPAAGPIRVRELAGVNGALWFSSTPAADDTVLHSRWRLAAPTVSSDVNGDGRSDVILRDPDSGQVTAQIRNLDGSLRETRVLGTEAANRVANGGFESVAAPAGWFTTYGTGSSIGGWRVTSGTVQVKGKGFWQSGTGVQSLDLNGDGTGAIAQDVSTTVGESYDLSFRLAGNPDGGPALKTVDVTWGPTGGPAVAVGRSTFSTTGRARTDMGWIDVSLLGLKATGTKMTLGFVSQTGGAFGPGLDGIVLRQAGAADWTFVAATDMTGDGVAELVWRQGSTGTCVVWVMNAFNTRVSARILGGDKRLALESTGDFDGDGRQDLIWRDVASEQHWLWRMRSAQPTSRTSLGIRAGLRIVPVDPSFDANGDGTSDILWRNLASGATTLWRMNGATLVSASVVGGAANGVVVGAADYDGDGKGDVLWRRPADGRVTQWLMNDGRVRTATVIGGTLDTTVISGGDFNGDGMGDTVWRIASTGTATTRLLSGKTILATWAASPDPVKLVVRRPGMPTV
ncbi:MAG: ELWxxDGT repeat protein [Pirellulales bacterium]